MCVPLLFTTVMSRQHLTAQEVTTFSRGLSMLREILHLVSLKNTPKESNCSATYDRLRWFIFYIDQPAQIKASNSCRQGSSSSEGSSWWHHSRGGALCRLRLLPVASSHRDVAGGGGKSRPTRKNLCFTHMWTGFSEQWRERACVLWHSLRRTSVWWKPVSPETWF